MNRQQASAVKPGQRVSWKCGRLRRFGRVLDQSRHPEAAAANCIAVSHNNHDVSWVEPRRLKLEDNHDRERQRRLPFAPLEVEGPLNRRGSEND